MGIMMGRVIRQALSRAAGQEGTRNEHTESSPQRRRQNGSRSLPTVRLTDIAPTVLDVTGCKGDVPVIDGRSLRQLMHGEVDGPRIAFSKGMLFSEDKHALRTGQFKYVRWANGKEELFDLQEDPRELRDLAASAADSRTLAVVESSRTQHSDSEASRVPPPAHAALTR